MKAENFYKLKVLAGFIAFLIAGGWLFFASELSMWWHLYAISLIIIFSIAAFLPTWIYDSPYRYPVGAIYIFVIILSVPIIYDGITSSHGVDYIGIIIAHLHLIVLGFFIKASLMKKNV